MYNRRNLPKFENKNKKNMFDKNDLNLAKVKNSSNTKINHNLCKWQNKKYNQQQNKVTKAKLTPGKRNKPYPKNKRHAKTYEWQKK